MVMVVFYVMVMMSVVMVVMMVMSALGVFNVAMLLVTMLTLRLKLKSCVTNSVFAELLAHLFLNFVLVTACNNVHCSIIGASVHAPNVNMVYTKHTVDCLNVFLYLIDLNTLGGFGKEEVKHFLEVVKRVYENKHRHSN